MASIGLARVSEQPYARLIENLVELEFPGSSPAAGKASFEATVAEIIGTKQHRYGPMPDPESLVAIRDVVREAMAQKKPIPILVPWGCSKQGPFGVDIAEMMALKQLRCLDARVKQHYGPGVATHVRLEDLTDEAMFAGDLGWLAKTRAYSSNFQKLFAALPPRSAAVLVESELMNSIQHKVAVDANRAPLLEALKSPEAERGEIVRAKIPEWAGPLDNGQLGFYDYVYSKFYPNDSPSQRTWRLATYFACAITRFQLRGTGAPAVLDDGDGAKYLTLSFTGYPFGKSGRRIYYRTIPARYTNLHRAPWLGKGYVRIQGGVATPAIAGWDGDGLDYQDAALIVGEGEGAVSVRSDYVVVS